MGCLSISETLSAIGIQDKLCTQCGVQDEDQQHLFRFCSFTQHIWISGYMNIHSNFDENLSLRDCVLYYIQFFISPGGRKGGRVTYFIGTLWALKVKRNYRIFIGEIGNVDRVFTHIRGLLNNMTFY